EPLSAELGNAAIGFQEHFCGDRAETHNDFGRDDIDLAQKKWRASGDFVFFGRAIFRWTAFHDVANVDVFALQAHGFDHLREKFPSTADKRKALGIFVRARTFSNKNELGLGISVAENDGAA